MRDGPISPPRATGGGRLELPAYLSNGNIGLRVREIPFHDGCCMVNGFAGEDPEKKIEAAAKAPYPLAADVSINGVAMSDTGHGVQAVDQRYDFSCGELTTRCVFVAEGVEVCLEVLTFCSRREPTIVCQEIGVRADRTCDLVLSAGLRSDGVDGQAIRIYKDWTGKNAPIDGSVRWQGPGSTSTCGLAYMTELLGQQDGTRGLAQNDGDLVTFHSFQAKSGKTYRLRHITSVVPGVLHSQPELQAARLVAMARELGFDVLRADNQAEWQELWKSRIKLLGADDRWQELADAAFFYLNSSVHPSAPASTSIFGLATWKNYHYYYGHVMWDIDCFVVPLLSLVQPRAAEAMLDFRFRTLSGAAANARLVGRGGLQFPWESAPSTGQEAAPLPGSAAWYEDHITLDVALAFAFHAHVTGDEQFLRDRAWPVLAGAAEWLGTRVTRTRRGYEILRSMGIAERESPSDNTAFTNMAAKQVLRTAIRIAQRLGVPIGKTWQQIEAGLVLPERDGILVAYDGYRDDDEKGATPDPLMGLFPLGFELTPEQERTTLEFYLRKADHYVGSPMLSALYGVWAARMGDRKLAARLLEEGYAAFMEDRFLQTLEYRRDRFPEQPIAGPFFANLGGFLMGLVLGFPGIAVDEGEFDRWARRPVVLPEGWEAIEIERLWIRGREATLSARQGTAAAVLNAR